MKIDNGGWKWIKVDEMEEDGWKWIKVHENGWDGWTWIKVDENCMWLYYNTIKMEE